ncbi:MAG: hypothetical protein DMG70_04955 [Acidobacteria bacterium]|nr:MAG: hypothetical protein DMG70_04955 [Acidobacteriota bacterium]
MAVAPRASTLMHRHRHDHGFITLGACEVENEVAGKPPVTLKLQDGETEFTPGNFTHVTKTSPTSGSETLTIELLQDAKARKSPPPKWRSCGGQVLKGEPRTSGS